MVTVYGIRSCDKCRKALRWFTAAGIEHQFHDLRADGLSATMLRRWLAQRPAEQLLNRRSTTWRECSTEQREALLGAKPEALILAQPTLIKRPLVEHGDTIIVGYDEASWRKL